MEWLAIALAVIVGVFLVSTLFGAPYLPSRYKDVVEAFEKLKPLTRRDVVVDFGCGDGVVLKAVGADAKVKRVIGIELNPFLALVSKWRNRGNKKVRVRCGNMLSVKLPEDMSVAYVFGLDRVMRMLLPRLLAYSREYKRDIWVVSLAFEFPGMAPVKKWRAYGLYKIAGR